MIFFDAKHISKKGNDFSKIDTFYGTIYPFSSFRDYCFGYVEKDGIGYISFIKNIKNPLNE